MRTTDKLLHLFKDGTETAWPELATGRLLAGLKECVRARDSETIARWRDWLALPDVPQTIRRSSPILEEDAAEWIHRNAVLLADGALGALGAPSAESPALYVYRHYFLKSRLPDVSHKVIAPVASCDGALGHISELSFLRLDVPGVEPVLVGGPGGVCRSEIFGQPKINNLQTCAAKTCPVSY